MEENTLVVTCGWCGEREGKPSSVTFASGRGKITLELCEDCRTDARHAAGGEGTAGSSGAGIAGSSGAGIAGSSGAGLSTCRACGRLYNEFVNDSCPDCSVVV